MSNPHNSVATLEVRDGIYLIQGELSFVTVPNFWTTSQSHFVDPPAALQIDLGAVTRTDSAGLALLVEWMRLARRQNRSITFRNVPQQLLNLARVSGVDQLLPMAPTGA